MGRIDPSKSKPPRSYSEKDLQCAIKDVLDGTFTIQESHVAYGVPYGTLYGRIKRGRTTRQEGHENQQLLTPAEEKTIVRWIEVAKITVSLSVLVRSK